MIVQCEKCQAPYDVEEQLIGEEGLGVACTACHHEFRVVRKVFYLVETLSADHGLKTIAPPVAPSPAPPADEKPATEMKVEAAPPPKPKRSAAASLALRTKHFNDPVEQGTSTWARPLFFLLLATVLAVLWVAQVYPEYYQTARGQIDQRVDTWLTSIQGKKIVDPVAKQNYLEGRGESVFDTEDHYRKAIDHYRKAVQIDPGYATAHGALSESAAELAEIEMRHGRDAEARNWMEEALRSSTRASTIDPTNLEAQRGLAAYERLQGQFVKAQEHLNEALQRDAANTELMVALGRNYLVRPGLEDMAERYLSKALSIDDRSVRAHRYLAVTYERMGRYPDSLDQWQKVLDLNAEHALAQFESERVKALAKTKASLPVKAAVVSKQDAAAPNEPMAE